jgi:hypothetical protein
VELTGLSFSAGTAGFNVYRGPNPFEFLRIAQSSAVAATFTDAGAAATLNGPPDANFDHANFYWRVELLPETAVGIHSGATIGNSTLGMLADDFKGGLARITRGKGATQERFVTANSTTTLTVTPPWTVEPDSTSFFTVAEGTWKFGGVTKTSPVQIVVPNRQGTTVEISGRSANVFDEESAYELNPVTRWQIGGGLGGGTDTDVPPAPVFGLNLAGQGTIELVGVGFTDFTNTHTIVAGTLGLFYWDELGSPTAFSLAAGITATDTTLTLSAAGTAVAGDLIQIEAEILQVSATSGGGTIYTVARGSHGSTAAVHAGGSLVYHLKRGIWIAPFVRGFFGSPASGSFSYSIFLPDVRVGAAELFMTNTIGDGPEAGAAFGTTVDAGLRTLAGGQLSIQVEGYLAVETDAAPPLVVETALAVRDIFATVNEAPHLGDLTLQLRVGSAVYCTLTIAADSTVSSPVVNGFGLAALPAGAIVSLDITGVATAVGSLPGRDLTVTVRL